jgi:starch phosphorylase
MLKQSMHYQFTAQEVNAETGEFVYVLELSPELCGKLECRIRVYPHHIILTHPFEMGLMRWL